MKRGTGAAFALTLARNVDAIAGEQIVRNYAALDFASTDVEKDADGVPIAFRMWRAGVNRTDHGDHVLTPKSVSTLLARQETRGNLFSVDVDHMSLNDESPPENHKAVGWFEIEERDGDLWAVNVKWTDAVRAGLTKDPPEWRYFSPAYDTKKGSGEITRLLNLALTNNPATHHVTALANATAGDEESTMADDVKKEESLAAMLAAYDDEKDDKKREEMKTAIKAKFKAAFGDEEKPEPKPEPAPEEKKETKAAEPAPENKETKADEPPAQNEEKIAASIADKAIISFEQKRRERDENAEKDRILASLPAGDRETYKDLTLPQVQRIVKRHHTNVLSTRANASSAMPTRGATETEQRGIEPPPTEREALDREMGLSHRGGWLAREVGTTLEFNHWATPKDAERALASIAEQRASIAKSQSVHASEVRDGDSLNRVLATQRGVV